MNETLEQKKQRVRKIIQCLRKQYPHAKTALKFSSAFELLIATILSAQCTDKRVNIVTPNLFSIYPTVEDLAHADQEKVENIIKSTGFYRVKAKNIIATAQIIVNKYHGVVPSTLEELTSLPGVGRKTAHCVLGGAFGINSGVVVDTHVLRISYRLGLTHNQTPEKVEYDLMKVVPKKDWYNFSNMFIEHGRAVCKALKPRCNECVINSLCPKILSKIPKGKCNEISKCS